jgi:hypothetical protein
VTINGEVGLHEGLVELGSEEECIWRADILDNRVEDVDRGEFLVSGRLVSRQQRLRLEFATT